MERTNYLESLDEILSGHYSPGEMWNEFYIDEAEKILHNLSQSDWNELYTSWKSKSGQWQTYLADALESAYPSQLRMIETMLEGGLTGDGVFYLAEELCFNSTYIPTERIFMRLSEYLRSKNINESSRAYFEELVDRYKKSQVHE